MPQHSFKVTEEFYLLINTVRCYFSFCKIINEQRWLLLAADEGKSSHFFPYLLLSGSQVLLGSGKPNKFKKMQTLLMATCVPI